MTLDWDEMIAKTRAIVERDRKLYRQVVQMLEMERAHRSTDRALRDLVAEMHGTVPDELIKLWDEEANLRRQTKALWLREILEDYEY